MKSRYKCRGLTLVEGLIVLAILAALLSAIVAISNARSDNETRIACLSQMNGVLNMLTVWSGTREPSMPNGDLILCKAAKASAEAWNKQCAEVMGSLPKPEACV